MDFWTKRIGERVKKGGLARFEYFLTFKTISLHNLLIKETPNDQIIKSQKSLETN